MEPLRRLFHSEPTWADHQKTLSDVIARTDLSAQAKGDLLAQYAKLYSSKPEVGRFYQSWANGQYVYHYLHAPNLSDEQRIAGISQYPTIDVSNTICADRAMSYRERINWLWKMQKSGKLKSDSMPSLIASVVVADLSHQMSVRDKVVVLQSWLKKFKANPKAYPKSALPYFQQALEEQKRLLAGQTASSTNVWLTPIQKTAHVSVSASASAEIQSQPGPKNQNPAPRTGQNKSEPHAGSSKKNALFSSSNHTPASLLAQPAIALYRSNRPDLAPSILSTLQRYWPYIQADCDALLAHQGDPKPFSYNGLSLWGPKAGIRAEALAAEVALHYLKCEADFRQPGMSMSSFLIGVNYLHSIASQETGWNPVEVGYSGGDRNGLGLYQLTPSVLWDIGYTDLHRSRLDSLIKTWDPQGLNPKTTQFYNPSSRKWEDVILVRRFKGDTSPISPQQWKAENDPKNEGHVPARWQICWNPAAESPVQNPAFSIDLAWVVMIYKGARPGMTKKQAYKAAYRYNGNARAPLITVRVGRKKKTVKGPSVQEVYAEKVSGGYMPYYQSRKKEIETQGR
ncbi:Uncharacterised protein [uncultured archaeon]|nr:Uncharacterised protein [uncultured archaeon]